MYIIDIIYTSIIWDFLLGIPQRANSMDLAQTEGTTSREFRSTPKAITKKIRGNSARTWTPTFPVTVDMITNQTVTAHHVNHWQSTSTVTRASATHHGEDFPVKLQGTSTPSSTYNDHC